MKPRYLGITLLIITALYLAACGSAAPKAGKIEPAKVERVGQTDFSRVVLTEDAVKRIAIQTAQVVDDQTVRMRTVGGEVLALPGAVSAVTATSAGTVAAPEGAGVPAVGTLLSAGQAVLRLLPSGAGLPAEVKAPRSAALVRLLAAPGQTVEAGQRLFEVADTSSVLVRVPMYAGDLDKVDRSRPAKILPLAKGSQSAGVSAQVFDRPVAGDAAQSGPSLYYLVDSQGHGLAPGRRVQVTFALAGIPAQQKVIPYSSVIYDLKGATWAYTNPEPRTFIRQSITVDYIDGDKAFLSQGPSAGTAVVSVGAAELYGTEFGVGK